MEFTLNKSQRLVTNAAAKDESRPVLTCVHIRKRFIEAANGWILVQKKVDYAGDEQLLLKAKEVARCRDDCGGVTFTTDGKEVRAIGLDKSILGAQEGAFPDADKLYPYPMNAEETIDRLSGKGQKEVFRIALSRERLLEVLKCFAKDESDVIRFHFYGTKSPVAFEVTGSAKGMIMPMQVNWEEK